MARHIHQGLFRTTSKLSPRTFSVRLGQQEDGLLHPLHDGDRVCAVLTLTSPTSRQSISLSGAMLVFRSNPLPMKFAVPPILLLVKGGGGKTSSSSFVAAFRILLTTSAGTLTDSRQSRRPPLPVTVSFSGILISFRCGMFL